MSFTLFAPTNKAFERVNLPIDIDLQSNLFTMKEKDILKPIIKTHAIDKEITFKDLICNRKLQTLNESQIQTRCSTNSILKLQKLKKFMVSDIHSAFGQEDAMIILSTQDAKIINNLDVFASNGIIHPVNNVILPELQVPI